MPDPHRWKDGTDPAIVAQLQKSRALVMGVKRSKRCALVLSSLRSAYHTEYFGEVAKIIGKPAPTLREMEQIRVASAVKALGKALGAEHYADGNRFVPRA